MAINIIRSNSFDKEKHKLASQLVMIFFKMTDELKQGYSEDISKLSNSADMIRDVFRHSVCIALGLQSVPAYTDIDDNIYKIISNSMKPCLEGILSKSISAKQAILQAGVHYIVFITRSRKSDFRVGGKISG